jgi:peptide chain release factor subunit 1
VAGTINWDSLRELAGFRAENGCSISFYLNLDPSVAPTPGDAQTHVRSLVAEGERSNGAARPDLTHDQKAALKADFERIRRYFEEDFVRNGARGFAVFCSQLDGLWSANALTDPVPDEVKVGRDLYLAPLVPLVGRGEGALVAVVGRERGQIFRLRAGRLEELVDRTEEQPYSRHDQGGWSQSRYQRHVEELVADHLRRVAGELDRHVRGLRSPKLVVVASEETRAEFESMLSHDVRNAVVGWTQAEAHAGPPELLVAATPVLETWRAREQERVLERWREEAAKGVRGVSGWKATMEAASDGRVELLLVQEGANRPGWQCPACGRVAAEAGACPLDGTAMEESDAGLDLAIHQTLAHGGTIWVVRGHRDLEPVEGVGAVLRF